MAKAAKVAATKTKVDTIKTSNDDGRKRRKRKLQREGKEEDEAGGESVDGGSVAGGLSEEGLAIPAAPSAGVGGDDDGNCAPPKKKAKKKKKKKKKERDEEGVEEKGESSVGEVEKDREEEGNGGEAASKVSATSGDGGRPEKTPVDPINSFASVRPPLSSGILSAVKSYGFSSMTPVQAATLPLFLTHRDVFVRAVTGSGKTLAFIIPCLEMISRRPSLLGDRQIGALVLEPTRELARQTYDVAVTVCRHCGAPEPLLLVGGKSGHRPVASDLQNFARLKSDIVVGTPGRVEDVLTRYDDVDVSELEVLVLDESDVLLDMGFEVTLTSILGRLPKMRRTGLFSATNASGVRRLAVRAGMRNPVVVDVAIAAYANVNETSEGGRDGGDDGQDAKDAPDDEGRRRRKQATPSTLSNHYLVCPLSEKLSRLSAFLRQHSSDKVIVFFLTCASVEFYGTALGRMKSLPCEGYSFEVLHGKLAQKRREKAMERFRMPGGGLIDGGGDANANAETNDAGCALLCTDVAARGLDVPDVSWTVQFDAPVDPASYIHRVGRSARAGRFGKSLLFLTRKEEAYVDFLRLRGVPLEELLDVEVCKPPSEEDNDNEKLREGAKVEEDDDGGGNDETMNMEEKGAEKNEKKKETTATTTQILSAVGSTASIPDVLPLIRKMASEDRDVLEKGTKAFTSYVRAYKEHQCGFIFRFASLDLGILAASFCLLRLPKMPELRDKKLRFSPAGPEVDIHAIPFKDKAREKARQKRLATELAAGGKNAKQIKAEQRAAERLRKSKEKRVAEIAKGRNPNKKKGRQAQIFDEWDELAKEERLFKKLRSKKISREEHDRQMFGGKADVDLEGGDGSGAEGDSND